MKLLALAALDLTFCKCPLPLDLSDILEINIPLEVVMHRICLLVLGLFLLLPTYASAEIYRCRTSDGELVMTDQKSNFPADCQPVEEPTDKGSFNIVPSAKVDEVESQPAPPEQVATPDTQGGQNEYLEIDRSRAPLVRREYKDEMHSDSPVSVLTPDQQPPVREPMHKGPKK